MCACVCERGDTYVDVDVDVRGQACQGVDINVVITELWGGRPGGCAGGGGGGGGGGRCNCKWKKVSCWLQNAIWIKIMEEEAALPVWTHSKLKQKLHTHTRKNWIVNMQQLGFGSRP